VPTRLLDFTESPYVALYFGLEAYAYKAAKDLSIFAVDWGALRKKSMAIVSNADRDFRQASSLSGMNEDEIFEKHIDTSERDIIWVAEPTRLNARLDRQSGSFLLSGNRGKRIEELIFSEQYTDVPIDKIVIPGRLFEAAYALLRRMNINSKSLYGDLHGLGREILLMMKVYAIPGSGSRGPQPQ
jgi:hypothetical protein